MLWGPFLPLPAARYAQLLGEKIDTYGSNVYLVNTGWSGGAYGKGGSRIKLPLTRAMVSACLDGSLENVEYEYDPIFNLEVPKTCPGVPDEILSPRKMWEDEAKYEKAAKKLAKKFRENFEKYTNMPKEVVDAGPKE